MEASVSSTASALRGDIDVHKIPPPSQLFQTTVSAYRKLQQQMERPQVASGHTHLLAAPGMEAVPTSGVNHNNTLPVVQPITTRTIQRDHKRFLKKVQGTNEVITSPHHTVTRHRPFQQMWNRLSTSWSPKVLVDTIPFHGAPSGVTGDSHDPVVQELTTDVARLVSHVGSRCLGLRNEEQTNAMTAIVKRNLDWMHQTPDWMKLVGLFATKRVLQGFSIPSSPSSEHTFSSSPCPMMTDSNALPFLPARVHAPDTTEATTEPVIPAVDVTETVSDETMVPPQSEGVVSVPKRSHHKKRKNIEVEPGQEESKDVSKDTSAEVGTGQSAVPARRRAPRPSRAKKPRTASANHTTDVQVVPDVIDVDAIPETSDVVADVPEEQLVTDKEEGAIPASD